MADLGEAGKARPGMIGLDRVAAVPHIVDELIAERGRRIVSSRHWPLIKPFLYQVLRYKAAVRMADALSPLPGPAAMDYCSSLLSLKLEISGLENIPATGACIIAANHPTGIADGIAVYDAIRRVRPDVAIFTNRDATRINPRLSEYLIPVEWREDFRDRTKTRETLRLSSRAFSEGRAVVLFPSGRIAYWAEGRLNERPWQSTAVALARKQNVPIVPVNVQARNSWLFYWFANSGFVELRDMTVFHELLNKRGKTFRIHVGPLIPQPRLADGETSQVTTRLQAHVVDRIATEPEAVF